MAYALRRAEQNPREGSPTGPLGPLTAREREVTELVRQGLTNREIGARLKLSPHTVGTHLDRIRSKLGIRSRTQIALWLTDSTPPTTQASSAA